DRKPIRPAARVVLDGWFRLKWKNGQEQAPRSRAVRGIRGGPNGVTPVAGKDDRDHAESDPGDLAGTPGTATAPAGSGRSAAAPEGAGAELVGGQRASVRGLRARRRTQAAARVLGQSGCPGRGGQRGDGGRVGVAIMAEGAVLECGVARSAESGVDPPGATRRSRSPH